jgi:hypothetical protein
LGRPDLSQQPDGAPTLTLVDPAAEVEPTIVAEPAHGVALLGAGTVSMGLTPPLSNSVAPSGIVPPLSLRLELPPGLDSGEAVPAGDSTCDDVQLDVEVADPVALNPPPSKVEVAPVPVVLGALAPDIPKLDPLALQFAVAAGLTPPGSISVAPSGMPVPLDPVEPSVPSGEVAPIADVLVGLCARPAPQLIRITAVIASNLRIDTSCRCKDERCARAVPLN